MNKIQVFENKEFGQLRTIINAAVVDYRASEKLPSCDKDREQLINSSPASAGVLFCKRFTKSVNGLPENVNSIVRMT